MSIDIKIPVRFIIAAHSIIIVQWAFFWTNFKLQTVYETESLYLQTLSNCDSQKLKNMYEKTFPNKRFKHTLEFLQKHISTSETIFDLGVPNPFSKIMEANGYNVKNTTGEDIDNNQTALQNEKYTVFTAFEIFEHLLNPYTVLENVKCDKLLISIPLRLWFSSAYRSKTDMWDRHYHEFEDWQLDWLLEKTGWKIIDREKFTHPVKKIGFRPLLRFFTPRYYMVYAEKIHNS